MTFDNVTDMRIGSKKVKEAWLNGRQVYPSKKRIMDSLVLWYDIKRQGATNENMAASPVLRDLSGNGHDATCYNFAWSLMSGIGGYNMDSTDWAVYSSAEYTRPNATTIHITKVAPTNNDLLIAFISEHSSSKIPAGTKFTLPAIKYKVTGIKGNELRVYVRGDESGYSQVISDGVEYYFEGGEFTTSQNIICGFELGWTENDKTEREVDIIVELLPIYPNALVSDGVDDYAQVTGLPILTKERGYTVVAKRKWIDPTANGCLANKRFVINDEQSAFTIEQTTNNGSSFTVNNFNSNNNIQLFQEDVTILTTNSYNGIDINIGNGIDNNSMNLIKTGVGWNFYGKLAIYSFLLFDRDLTEQEIEWVKTNMIEYKGVTEEWYGVEFYTTSPYPDCIRIGNMELHKTLPVHIQMKGCLLSDDGVVNKYLNETDWTSETRDGSQGQVMVEMPKDSYWKFETEGNIRRVKFSTKPLPGFTKTPQGYVSAYEATVQRSVNKLASVVNTTAEYRGCNNQADRDGTYRSALGMPATLISRINFRNYARNRKAGSTAWNCYVYDMHKLLYWLFVVEYATLNSQKAYNSALTEDGYRQGGLGYGVTTLDWEKWGNFNGNYPFIPCGYTDSLGNGTGVVEYSMPTEYDASVKKVSVPRYRGIENHFGHIWEWTDGINVRISPNEPDGDGLSKVYVCSDPSKFNDTNYDGYTYVGDEARTNAYVKSVIFGEGGEIIPSVCQNASTETYFCDFHYTNIPNNETLRGLLLGGHANNGANAGFVYADSDVTPSNANTNVGSRLCFIPA